MSLFRWSFLDCKLSRRLWTPLFHSSWFPSTKKTVRVHQVQESLSSKDWRLTQAESFVTNQVNGKDSSSPLQDHHAAFRNIMHARKILSFLLIAWSSSFASNLRQMPNHGRSSWKLVQSQPSPLGLTECCHCKVLFMVVTVAVKTFRSVTNLLQAESTACW